MGPNQLFTILDAVESTNNYAMAKVHAGLAVHGEAWFTREQWGGKGQRENRWISERDKNILMTIVLQPSRQFKSNIFLFNTVIACSCHQFFSNIAGEGTFLKWPNDIYFNDRKAGGILIENIIGGNNWKWAIVGIGINVNQLNFDDANPNAASLGSICNKIFETIELAKELQLRITNNIESFNDGLKDFYFAYYNKHLYKKGEIVKLKKDNIILNARIKEVNTNGQLVAFDVIERQFNTGEVKWVL